MKLIPVAVAFCLAAGFSFAAPAIALPLAPAAPHGMEEGNSMIVPVRGCHRSVRRHYVPEIGRSISHFHRGRYCRPLRAVPPRYRDPVRVRDCHRDVRRHYLPQYGSSVVHRHSRSCRPIAMRRFYDDYPRNGFCVTIGGFRYCD